MSGGGGNGRSPVEVVSELYAAMRDSRLDDVLALVDPEVICMPLVRPGLAEYEGHAGMARLVRDLHAVHGRYEIVIVQATEEDGPEVTVHATLVPEPGRGAPFPVTSSYRFRRGLISSIESFPADP